jgi:hypothetical protein
MQSDYKKTERSLQSSAKNIQSNGQTFKFRSFAEYTGPLILALLKVEQYSSNAKRVITGNEVVVTPKTSLKEN